MTKRHYTLINHVPKYPLQRKVDPLIDIIFKEMNKKSITYGQVSTRSGVSIETFRNWRRGQLPCLINLLAIYSVCGLKLKAVIIPGE